MKRLALFLLLLAAPAHAATFTYNFDRSVSDLAVYPCNLIQTVHGPVTSGGITATFGDGWAFGLDCDDLPECECPWELEMRNQNNFANEPSSGGVGANCPHEGQSATAAIITFNPPIRFVSFWYSRAAQHRRFYTVTDCSEWQEIDASAFYLRLYSVPNSFPTVAALDLTGTGGGVPWELGCSGDPTGEYCGWTYVELTVPPNKPAVNYVGIEAGIDPLYIDNLTAADGECAHPPCEFERAHLSRQDRATGAVRSTWGAVKVIYR